MRKMITAIIIIIYLCEKDNNSNNYNCTETAIITKVNNANLKQ